MSRIRIALIALAAASALIASSAAPAAPAKARGLLIGTVGPGFSITLKNAKNGQKVTTLPAGLYVFKVVDKASIHNFRLKGPGVNKEITGVGFTGTKFFTVTLKKGKYSYVCDPHSSLMHGSFVVT